MEILLLLAVLLILILAGAPVGFTLILIPVVYILITDAAPLILMRQFLNLPGQEILSVPLKDAAHFSQAPSPGGSVKHRRPRAREAPDRSSLTGRRRPFRSAASPIPASAGI